ncbi:uncharacterized protein VTP21DRAFT_1822 [Calcarisporiella thermophila]|uniref:uncharacterized protein n=1 Tax=Calcarisporiella thermophila TaxID=911321 RepID=UPI00374247F4
MHSTNTPLRILHYTPHHGTEGTTLCVALHPPAPMNLKLGIGALMLETLHSHTPAYDTLTAQVPPQQQQEPRVPVFVLEVAEGAIVDKKFVGEFIYEEQGEYTRKRSGEEELDQVARKRLGSIKEDDYLASFYGQNPAKTFQQHQQPWKYTEADQPLYSPSYVYGLGVPPPLNTDFLYAMPQQPQPQPQAQPTTAAPHHPHHPGSENNVRDNLRRQYQPPLPGASTPAVLSNYNFYASLLNKANLKFSGNLDDMARNWSQEEWENRRRLVQFWRRQDGNDIHCNFSPIAPADCSPNSIVVSCIYWQEKNDCYITSVDCIYLMESLIGVRFTVEEKNRIRRNLEGFRPSTVSKCKPESAEFFKLIMSFPNPKPRNIEKDVKVFPWRVLPFALKKIISKYTASYSSTASVNVDAFQESYQPSSAPQLLPNSQHPMHLHNANGDTEPPLGFSASGGQHLEVDEGAKPGHLMVP